VPFGVGLRSFLVCLISFFPSMLLEELACETFSFHT